MSRDFILKAENPDQKNIWISTLLFLKSFKLKQEQLPTEINDIESLEYVNPASPSSDMNEIKVKFETPNVVLNREPSLSFADKKMEGIKINVFHSNRNSLMNEGGFSMQIRKISEGKSSKNEMGKINFEIGQRKSKWKELDGEQINKFIVEKESIIFLS